MVVGPGEFWYFIGNSISVPYPSSPNEGGYAYYQAPGAFNDQLNARWSGAAAPPAATNGARTTGVAGRTSGSGAAVNATVPGYRHVIVGGSGHSGATAQEIADDLVPILPTLPAVASPVFVIEGGINDANNIHNASETIGQFNTGHDLIYTRILARFPAARIIDLTCFCLGELHTGGVWGSNPADAEIATVNAAMAVIAAARGGLAVDIRTPLLAWEIINNPSNLVGGLAVRLEGNNVHPTIRGMVEVIGPAILAALTVAL